MTVPRFDFLDKNMQSENQFDDEEYEIPANTMEDLLFRELSVLKLGVGREQRIPFQLRYSEQSGRGMMASRSIKRGEIIVEESPAVSGPKASFTGASCLECAQPLATLSVVTFCDLCHLHFCRLCTKPGLLPNATLVPASFY